MKVDHHGNLFYMGRADQQIKRHGQRINLTEIKLVCNVNSIFKKATTISNRQIDQVTKDK